MKIKLWTIIRIVTLLTSVVTLVLVLEKPAPVAQPQTPAAIAANAKSFSEKMEQFSQASQPRTSGGSFQVAASEQSAVSSEPKAEVHLSSDEVGAALAQATGTAELSPASNVGNGAPAIKDERVSFEGDVVHGQFLAEVAGKDVWVTVSGHLGSKDGYATFDPTEFKVGDMTVPVSLVNPTLQKKLAEQRDQLKLPDYVGDVRVQNGELIMQQK
jgi:hypothetical protein